MPSVPVRLPAPLREVLGTGEVVVEGKTLAALFDDLRNRYPELAVHLFDETGGLRQHVLCFHNGASTRWLEDLAVPVRDGDELTVTQAVSGG